jgi:hypothetical protein
VDSGATGAVPLLDPTAVLVRPRPTYDPGPLDAAACRSFLLDGDVAVDVPCVAEDVPGVWPVRAATSRGFVVPLLPPCPVAVLEPLVPLGWVDVPKHMHI